ncbi:MAG: hypothetical protein QOJ59_1069 [Thermomicrobiales bacterium]|jgi:hypothetical protein|nr:hypothetical protein [Thermomicrobiales bacterium]
MYPLDDRKIAEIQWIARGRLAPASPRRLPAVGVGKTA